MDIIVKIQHSHRYNAQSVDVKKPTTATERKVVNYAILFCIYNFYMRMTSRTASLVIDWTPERGTRWSRPKRSRQDTCREDMQEMGVSVSDTHEARSVAQ